MDETDSRGKGQGSSRERAVDHHGQTIAVLCTAPRAAPAAQRFLPTAIRRHDVPEQSTLDGSVAQEAAIKSSQAAHGIARAIRQRTSLHHKVAPDHRAVKRSPRPLGG